MGLKYRHNGTETQMGLSLFPPSTNISSLNILIRFINIISPYRNAVIRRRVKGEGLCTRRSRRPPRRRLRLHV